MQLEQTNQFLLFSMGFPRDHGEFQLRGPRRPRHRVSKAEMAPEVLLPRRELQLLRLGLSRVTGSRSGWKLTEVDGSRAVFFFPLRG